MTVCFFNIKYSVFEYDKNKLIKKSPIPIPIILDGKIQYETLREMDRDDSFIYKDSGDLDAEETE